MGGYGTFNFFPIFSGKLSPDPGVKASRYQLNISCQMKHSFKVLLFALGALLAVSPALRAQDAPPPQEGPGGNMQERMKKQREKLIKELALTAEQQAKWAEIDQLEKAALEALRADQTIAREDKRTGFMAIMKKFSEQRRAVLTVEQQAKYDAILAKQREKMKKRGNQDDAPPPPPEN